MMRLESIVERLRKALLPSISFSADNQAIRLVSYIAPVLDNPCNGCTVYDSVRGCRQKSSERRSTTGLIVRGSEITVAQQSLALPELRLMGEMVADTYFDALNINEC